MDDHPSAAQLSAFCLGQLDEQQAAEVESHVSHCPPCGETLLGLSTDDTFVALLKESQQGESAPTLHAFKPTESIDGALPFEVPPSLAAHSRYKIVGLLGHGGMGDVYKAEHRMMERCVALKVIKPTLVAKQDAVERFRREVKAAARLSHPNIVAAYDAEQAGDHHFLIMEYVDGVNLAESVREQGPLPIDRACEYVRQAALGLQHAFEKGMVHRDIKPHNLMITQAHGDQTDEPAIVKILDFGLATLSASPLANPDEPSAEGELTLAGAIMGTPDFISPEQATDASSVDIRSDIYSLGATLYYLLAGRAPFADGSTMHKLRQHAEATPEPIDRLRSAVPQELTHVVRRMLAKDPADRFQTPAELAEALAPFVASQQSAFPSHSALRTQQPAAHGRNRAAWWAAACGTLGLIMAGLAYLLTNAGTLEFRTPDENLAVRVLRTIHSAAQEDSGDGVTSTTKVEMVGMLSGSRTMRLAPGTYHVALDPSNQAEFQLNQTQFTLERGGQVVVIATRRQSPSESLVTASSDDEDSVATDDRQSSTAADPAEPPVPLVTPAQVAARPESFVYYTADLSDVQFEQNDAVGLTAGQRETLNRRLSQTTWVWTYVTMDVPGDAYLTPPAPRSSEFAPLQLGLRVPQAQRVRGKLCMPNLQGDAMLQLAFEIDAASWKPLEDSRLFFELQRDHYDFLISQNIPGAAWFRHQEHVAAEQLGRTESDGIEQPSRRVTASSIDRSFSLLSGGVALSENLQLDKIIDWKNEVGEQVAVDSLRGITVNAFDWGALNRGKEPQMDALATSIPADQHAFFFATFAGLLHTLDHADRDGLRFLQLAKLENEQADLMALYQRQLGLSLNDLARMLGPQLVRSLVVTGSDPYFDTGTDIAVVFEPTNQSALAQLLEAQIALAAAKHRDSQTQTGDIEGVAYTSYVSPDRSLSSYLATIGDAVVITNSAAQLKRLVATSLGRAASIDSTPEYRFFRDRYSIDAQDTSGLLVITDLTIRRWCSPGWRIGAARRLFARAAMAAMQAEHLDSLRTGVKQRVWGDSLESLTGPMTVSNDDVRSEVYGTLAFLTPIAELDLRLVSAAEAKAYEKWRRDYERAWRQTFDPIAIHFHAFPDRWSVDMTVLPLVARSEYNMAIAITRDAKIVPAAADPHPESILNFSIAIDKESSLVKMLGQALTPQLPAALKADPLAWFGSTISLYADEDPFWLDEENDAFNIFSWGGEIPIAINIEVQDHVSLLPFLIGLRRYIEQGTPGMTTWETLEHAGRSYVKIAMTSRPALNDAADQRNANQAVYYVVLDRALVIAPSERMIRRAIDRADRPSNDDQPVETAGRATTDLLAPQRWLGENIAVQLDGPFIPAIQSMLYGNYEDQMRAASWKNLPILNEWKRRFSGDPLTTHERYWKRELQCLGGGNYRWNEPLESMESSVFGPPGTVLAEDYLLPIPFQNVDAAKFGLTFEHGGLRARMNIQHKE